MPREIQDFSEAEWFIWRDHADPKSILTPSHPLLSLISCPSLPTSSIPPYLTWHPSTTSAISPFWNALPSFPENATPHTSLPSCIILQLVPTFWLIKCLPNFSLIQKNLISNFFKFTVSNIDENDKIDTGWNLIMCSAQTPAGAWQ